VRYWSKIAGLNLLHLDLAPPFGVSSSEFRRDFWRQKTKIPWVIVWHCLHDPTFSGLGTIPACDGRTERRTNRSRRQHTA